MDTSSISVVENEEYLESLNNQGKSVGQEGDEKLSNKNIKNFLIKIATSQFLYKTVL